MEYGDSNLFDQPKQPLLSSEAAIAKKNKERQEIESLTALFLMKGGKISQTNPGVFFYFTGLSGNIEGVDGADPDSAVDPISLTIDQSKSGATSMFGVANNGIQLYKVNDLNNNGSIDATDSLTSVALNSSQIVYGTGADAGDITINFTPDQIGSMYLLSVKYTTASVVGNPVSKPYPLVHYEFDTKVGGIVVETYAAGIDLAPKPGTKMMLAGEEGDGAKAVKAVQLGHVIDAAVSWWEAHADLTDAQLAQLNAASVSIEDLGQEGESGWILGENDGDAIMIDDDAAGHGWSLGLGGVAHNKVDLFSVLVHEMGHLLGKTDEEMGAALAVGERLLPTMPAPQPDDAGGQPDTSPALAVLGSTMADPTAFAHLS